MRYTSSLLCLVAPALAAVAKLAHPTPHSRAEGQPSISGNKTTPYTMLQLSSDPSFHFELLRTISIAPYQGADIGEVLTAVNKIAPGDFESYYSAFNQLTERVHGQVERIDAKEYPVSARNAYFREATYLRSADFFLHGNWDDPRINSLWDKHLAAFNNAIALLPVPGERVTLQAKNFSIPAIFYGSGLPGPRPTILMCNGFDGSQEELYHVFVEAVLQRGMNVITFEGPGQPTVRREQNLGFIPEWEQVVTPVVDYVLTRKDVDRDAIGLWGYSLGGYLVARAAAFDHRFAAIMAIDGVYDFGATVFQQFPDELKALFKSGNETAFNQAIEYALSIPNAPTSFRWAIQQGLWAFNTKSPFEWATKCQAFTLADTLKDIKAPLFCGDAQNDDMFPGQAKELAQKLGELATYHLFEAADGAGEHCSVGASVLQNQVVLDWFQDVVARKCSQ